MDSQQEEPEYQIKILIIGNSGAGKSCILTRFTWDTAGQDRFKTITSSYYKGSHGIIIVYDIQDKTSFQKVSEWIVEIEKHASENVNMILVGNKSDLNEKRCVQTSEGQMLASQYKMPFMECSAKQSYNIENIFLQLSKDVLNRLGETLKITQMGINLKANNIKRQSQLNQKKDDLDIENCCS